MIWGDPGIGLAVGGVLSGAVVTVSLVITLVRFVMRLAS